MVMISIVFGLVGGTGWAAPAAAAPASQRQGVHLRGELATRYAAATANLFGHRDRYGLDSFAASARGRPGALWWDWPGDQIGRWLSVLHVAEENGWSTAADWRRMVADTVLPLQNEKGYFGPDLPFDQKDARIVSGNAFALRGLMDAYEDTGEEHYLRAARRLRGYFESTSPSWIEKSGGKVHEFWGHCLDGLVKLHRLGGDAEALDLARRIAAGAGRTRHTHHTLSMYRGMLDLYAVTRDAETLDRVRDYVAWCAENRLVSGGLPESMPSSAQDEGCALADDVVVNLMMFRATGEMACLDDAERVLLNHFFMNQFSTGGFGHRYFSPEIVGGKNWQGWDGRFGSENPGCCSLWGAWALGQVGRYLITPVEGGFDVNLYAEADVAIPRENVRFTIGGDFPRCRRTEIAITCPRPRRFALRLRVPAWASGATVAVNGEAVQAPREGGRLVLAREWRPGDTVTLSLQGDLRAIRWPKPDAETIAVYDGPLCLALSSADADVAPPWKIILEDGKPARDDAGRFRLTDGEKTVWLPLRPIASDWLRSDVKDPNRLRILFGVEERRE
ncbi:MAG: glycoside hydrolase family 127 protein [Planctomycetes bacterium]|nr:glycoside hydrolase family 127 protein [Planctomycetota bacterium]